MCIAVNSEDSGSRLDGGVGGNGTNNGTNSGNVLYKRIHRCLLADNAIIMVDNTLWKGLVLKHVHSLSRHTPAVPVDTPHVDPQNSPNSANSQYSQYALHNRNISATNRLLKSAAGVHQFNSTVCSSSSSSNNNSSGTATTTITDTNTNNDINIDTDSANEWLTSSQIFSRHLHSVVMLPVRDGMSILRYNNV